MVVVSGVRCLRRLVVVAGVRCLRGGLFWFSGEEGGAAGEARRRWDWAAAGKWGVDWGVGG